ncbi:MAG: hypothetical protein KGJ49_10445 [Alphaproteobacteria bacterium]|nr:hypothetical protein [Alphaproteobacteria bacterium]
MPKKKHALSEEERRKRIRETAEKIGASNDPKILDDALKKIALTNRFTPN